ncbi:two-component hybrid sensor and regulator [Gemmatimonas aurantiaca T-27]|uniref:histidine kinase n=1 Tax=Gemmatimonas aurantiaca (strain DSM 14586 / JCM 11422 / NBRC 100505 / T-27) TaxID=379066 RepID=C1A758_GEMAT|nr:two-component hybrid sensor and regulator [Gemmatimonas aurantiaca T-27]
MELRLRHLHRVALLSLGIVATITIFGGLALERATGWVHHTREVMRLVRSLQAELFAHETIALRGSERIVERTAVERPSAELATAELATAELAATELAAAALPLSTELLTVMDSLLVLTKDNPAQFRRAALLTASVHRWNDGVRTIAREGSAVAALEAKLLLQQALQEFQSEEHRLYEARTTVERRWRLALLATILVSLVVIWYALNRFVRTMVRETRDAREAKALRDRTAERLTVLMDISPNPFAIVGLDDALVLVNTAWHRLESANPASDGLFGRLDPSFITPLRQIVDQARATHQTQRIELTDPAVIEDVSGVRTPRVWTATGYRVDQGADLEGAVCVTLVDVTSIRAIEQQMRQAQRLESIGRLAGGVAHDFNNILTAVIGFTDMAAAEAGESGRLQADLHQVRRAADRASVLTRQLLSFSRQQVLHPRVHSLGDIVRDLELMIRRLIGSHITVAVRIAPDTGHVLVDLGRIEQVILNLTINARDAMGAGGSLTVEVGNATPEDLAAAHERGDIPAEAMNGSYTLLRVRDTGTGMTPEVQRRIFEPFFTTKPVGQGTGLGLATVLNVVRESSGFIGLESAPDWGTTFELFLPRTTEALSVAVPTMAVHQLQRQSGTVLVVEDDRDVRQLTEYVLSEAGYTVHVARNGVDALEVLRRKGPEIDLLVTDLVMPGLGGVDLARHDLVAARKLPVLFLTGYATDATVNMTVLPSEAHVLAKPFTPAQLVEDVLSAL